jgi:peroxin-2
MTSVNFAAAQERVLARHAAREAEERTRLHLQHSRALSSPLSQLPFPLNRASGPLHSLWTALQGREGTRPAFRVGQVDAELLDEELLDLLKGQAGEALKYFGPHLADEWSQEILFALRAILFKLSIWDHDASYGAVLQNLRYTDARTKSIVPLRPSRWQKSLYGAFTVLGRYGWEKWESWLLDHGAGYGTPSDTIQLITRLTSWLSTTHSIAAFISFLVFLANGRYRTLTDRILRLRLTSPSSQVSREVSFEYLNRQLVWHAFTEFLLFLLPLVGISRWRRWLGRAWRKAKLALRSGADNHDADAALEKYGPLAHLSESTCAICYQDQNAANTSEAEILGINAGSSGIGVMGSATTDIVNPYQTIPCGCIYCFVCIATKLEAAEGEGWTCLRCGQVVKSCQPWNGDVLATKHGAVSSKTKTVGFVDDDNNGKVEEDLAEVEPKPEDDSYDTLGESSMWSSTEVVSSTDTNDSNGSSEKG